MLALVEAAGWPIWFLIIASVVALAIIGERLWSLRAGIVMPRNLLTQTINEFRQHGVTAQLLSRHWVIIDGRGHVEEVRGPGVVGEQPVLQPGQSFEYTSGCPLRTPHGSMHGSYQMVTAGGERFDAEIAPFALGEPEVVH